MTNREIVNKITNTSLIAIAIMSIPLNFVIFFALKNSEYLFPRFIPPFLTLILFALTIMRNKINYELKMWTFTGLIFFAGIFNLLLGLIDLASLWLITAVIFTLLFSHKNEAFYVFVISFIVITITGILMMTENKFIPLKYGFLSCQYACIIVRILHFLLIGFIIYYILKMFFFTIKQNIKDLQRKNIELEELNFALKKEMAEKKDIQQKMIDSVIFTEEKERKRLASELHDGLGPTLSAINLYFQAYVDANEKEKPEIQAKLQSIINDTAADISRIAQNISPLLLETKGFIFATKAFINKLKISDTIKFNLKFENIERFELKKELIAYRSVSELINNTLKYAQATCIFISIKKVDEQLKICYKDNGKGFDSNKITEQSAGLGLKGIENKIKAINGIFSFKTAINTGFSANILFKINIINE